MIKNDPSARQKAGRSSTVRVAVFGAAASGLAYIAGAVVHEATQSDVLRILAIGVVIAVVMVLGRPYTSRRG